MGVSALQSSPTQHIVIDMKSGSFEAGPLYASAEDVLRGDVIS